MKTIGLLGGMSWESTLVYYRHINQGVNERLGGLHSARIVLYSVDFHEIEQLQHAGEWEKTGCILARAAQSLEAGGADFIVLCTNTMHRVAPEIESAVKIPLLHIADATAEEIRKAGIKSVGLLGTMFTMEEDFYRGHLERKHGLRVLIPEVPDRELIHRVIYEELCLGNMLDKSRQQYVRVIRQLVQDGAEGVILGCTEISMLVRPQDVPVPVFDTTAIHARSAVEWALTDRDIESE